jgi:hypothetical protein
MTDIRSPSPDRRPFDFDLDRLLHPARAFAHPQEVLCDPDLTTHEKRAILASWISDACAVEAAPALRLVPGGKEPVAVDDVMDALRALDRIAGDVEARAGWKRALRKARFDRIRECRLQPPFLPARAQPNATECWPARERGST